jgi:hypothetical protein
MWVFAGALSQDEGASRQAMARVGFARDEGDGGDDATSDTVELAGRGGDLVRL